MTEDDKIDLEQSLAMTRKLNMETRKLIDESFKLYAERKLIDKKVRWFEIALLFSAFAVGIAFAKLFL